MNKDLIKAITKQRATMAIAVLWIAVYILGLFIDLMTPFEGKGILLTDGQLYRYITAPLLHFGLLHLLINLYALVWVGYYLEPEIGGLRFFLFALIAGSLSELCYCSIFSTSKHNIGGSVWLFALFGLILACSIMKKGFLRFRFNTWYGRVLVGYAILGNLPLLPFCTIGTVFTHAIAFAVGYLLASIGILCKVI